MTFYGTARQGRRRAAVLFGSDFASGKANGPEQMPADSSIFYRKMHDPQAGKRAKINWACALLKNISINLLIPEIS
jgi:hypothetical protein